MGFWPSLPIHIPASPGMPILWDIVWWLFQAVIMGSLLYFLRTAALRIDRVRDGDTKGPAASVSETDRQTPTM
jgi:hypothetical protein